MSLTKLALKIAAPLPKLESFDRFLFVGPHPDDIEIGAGATAARLAKAGKQVCFLICTDGRYGDGQTGLRGDALAAERRQEAIRSAAVLGVSDVRFLNLSDGGFYDMDELIRGIAQVMGDFQPEAVFTP
ncbi:MAG: PIG-L family deacetylase, partial [Clostridia bacterium]|nr:PIG-L family deacetylase [Clostridia bacterium]